jgi:putative flippase GtrA
MSFFHPARIRRHASQGIRFFVVGGSAALLELVTVTILVEVLRVPEAYAGGLSIIPSVTFVFFANKHFTFKAGESRDCTEVVRFAMVYVLAILMNFALYSFFLHLFDLEYRIAKASAIAVVACWNYCMSHVFIFKGKRFDPDIGL